MFSAEEPILLIATILGFSIGVDRCTLGTKFVSDEIVIGRGTKVSETLDVDTVTGEFCLTFELPTIVLLVLTVLALFPGIIEVFDTVHTSTDSNVTAFDCVSATSVTACIYFVP